VGNAVFGSKRPSTRAVARRHRCHHNVGVVLGWLDEGQRRDPGRAKYTDA
jgi:hypothetical protein